MAYLARRIARDDDTELVGIDRDAVEGDRFHLEVAKLLVARKLLRLTGLAEALRARADWGHDLAHILIAQGHVRRRDYYQAVADTYGLPFVDLGKDPVDSALTSIEDRADYTERNLMPWRRHGEKVAIINSGKPSSSDSAKKDPMGKAADSDSVKKAEDKSVDKKPALEKPAQEKEPGSWKSVGIKILVDKVEVNVLKPTRGAPPEGAKTEETYVLIVPVTLELKSDKVKQVEFTSWADDSLKKKVSLKDDQNKSYDLLEQVADKESDVKAITKTRIKVYLVFQAPTSKKLKFLHLALPVSAFHAEGVMIGYEIKPTDIQSAPAGNADKLAKTDETDAAESTPKIDKKKPAKADKPAKTDEGDSGQHAQDRQEKASQGR